jgi:ATP-dependent DNA helicase RecQ
MDLLDKQSLLKILKKTYGHDDFRLEQESIISNILDGKDVLGVMPTGGGKSVCFQLPALFKDGVGIVISPLISLMHDQVSALEELGVAACFLNSSQSYGERESLKREIIDGRYKLVYLSPESVALESTRDFLAKCQVSLFAIDEAHCVSQWGHEFRADYTKLYELKECFPHIPTVALTATADEKTRNDIVAQLKLNDPEIFISSFDRANIRYEIHERVNEIKQLHSFIRDNHSGETGIVYCLSRKKVEKVASELNKLGYNAIPYHAGLGDNVRRDHQDQFKNDEEVIVVATIAFGMGIDRPDVRFVAHLDLPKSIEGYYQETGRAGRDGIESSAWMVYGLQDVVKLSRMLEMTQAPSLYKKMARGKLDSILSLCETSTCRRHFLLGYFGEKGDETCHNCDSCLVPAETWDATVLAQMLLSAILRTNQIFGAGHIIDVLRGAKTTKVINQGHDQLSVYGIGADQNKYVWDAIIRQMLNLKYIDIKNWEYRSLGLTEKSLPVLKGQQKLILRKTKKKAETKKRVRKRSGGKSNRSQETELENYSSVEEEIFEVLRAERRKISKKNKVPPYIIFSDKSLRDMAMIRPRTDSEFLMVHGVGEAKLEKYGEVFLGLLSEYS